MFEKSAWWAFALPYITGVQNWFLNLTPEGQIILGIMLVLSTILAIMLAYYVLKTVILAVYYVLYGVFWFIGHTIYGVFWLSAQITKASLVASIIIVYVVLRIFLWLPIVAIIKHPFSLTDFMEEMAANVEDFAKRAYPAPKNTKKLSVSPSTHISMTPPAIMVPPAVTQIIVTVPTQSMKADELTAQTQIIRPTGTGITFHCNNCGTKFTDRMQMLLIHRHGCFCEKCGQRFVEENNLPRPVSQPSV